MYHKQCQNSICIAVLCLRSFYYGNIIAMYTNAGLRLAPTAKGINQRKDRGIPMANILVVEDDVSLSAGLKYALEKEGYHTTHCKSIADALKKTDKPDFDLALLDMQLPDGPGKEIASKLIPYHIPVIYVTVVDDEDEIVKSLDGGAADYVTKPFRMRELLARIKKALHGEKGNGRLINIWKAVINVDEGKVYIKDQPVSLTALEYRLLLIFAQNQSILLKREQILEHIWDISGNFVEDNTLTVYVKRLREKLGDAVNITTVRGIGYRVDQ